MRLKNNYLTNISILFDYITFESIFLEEVLFEI